MMRQFFLLLLISAIPVASAVGFQSVTVEPPVEIAPPPTPGPQFVASLPDLELAFATAIQQEATDCATSVDLYYQAATLAWPLMQSQLSSDCPAKGRPVEIYHYSLNKIIKLGQRYHRFDPRSGLHVNCGSQTFVPVIHTGFPRETDDFDWLIPVSSCGLKGLKNVYQCAGLGVTTVVRHRRTPDESFRREYQHFAATAILRPQDNTTFVFELLDPLRVREINAGGQPIKISRDLSAPILYRLNNQKRNYLESFLHPGTSDSTAGLFMLEPFQPDKIPIVFVHGLLSDPNTWANMANEIMARPEIFSRYQIWGFEYPTGGPFLANAADLREQLWQIQAYVNPTGADCGINQTVLVGHSMGGLISKLQITCSGDELWHSVSRCPLEEINAEEQILGRLTRAFCFDPMPSVSRVVYMGTPHRGSPWARRLIGQIGAKLVEEPSELAGQHQNLICNNPDNFSKEFRKRIPTSIDMLRPDSQLLMAIDRLPVADHVDQHSIIGFHRPMVCAGRSDGVVPVSSAVHPNVESELLLRSKHGKIHQHECAIDELVRILYHHANQ